MAKKKHIGGIKMLEEMFIKCPWYKKMQLLRVANGWSQFQAGEKCSTYHKNYWQWEKGEIYPSLRNRKIIARVFGVKIEYIFN